MRLGCPAPHRRQCAIPSAAPHRNNPPLSILRVVILVLVPKLHADDASVLGKSNRSKDPPYWPGWLNIAMEGESWESIHLTNLGMVLQLESSELHQVGVPTTVKSPRLSPGYGEQRGTEKSAATLFHQPLFWSDTKHSESSSRLHLVLTRMVVVRIMLSILSMVRKRSN